MLRGSMMSLGADRDRAHQRSVGSDDQLKFSQMFLQIKHGQPGHLPESYERLQIDQSGPAHLITGRTHFIPSLHAPLLWVKIFRQDPS